MLTENIMTVLASRHRHWTLKDYVILFVSMVLLFALRMGLPKLFKNADERVLNGVSWGIAIAFMLILIIAT